MRYVALLRGVNLAGKRKVAMADLVRCFGEAGCEDVRTYIQSGNVVFSSTVRSEGKLRATLEEHVREATGLDVAVVLRTAKEMAAVVEANPFPEAEPAKLLVGFLAEKPPAAAVESLDAAVTAKEGFVVNGREVYLNLPDGIGCSKAPVALDRIKPTVTARNWRTVTKLAGMV
ncbi:MAG: DUF1697 domain-containing protein, partial [Acidimicrobiia bacterium]